ncbi:hypothetical protein [Nocardioides sp. 616]|uniref:hypothetical protein n=1 Tax=Nocardioides sp. 616 TaxID=2268090 RepID=UPI000CE37884|nr:hypothetical protein [Nocardioides sp. 616]
MGDRREQRRRARWMEEQLRALDRLDARHGLGASPFTVARPRPRRTYGPALVGLGVVLVLLVAGFLTSTDPQVARVRELFGIEVTPTGDVPGAHYTFMQHQQGSPEPIGYDPCTPIRYEVNAAGAPEDYLEYVETSVERVSEASGLVFEYVGLTDSRNFDLDGDVAGRPPVLVGWATEDEYEPLAGNVAGVAGSAALPVFPGHAQYVTGRVVLDTEVFGSSAFTGHQLQPIVDHEFAHLVGLDHVEDPGELMDTDGTAVTRFGEGDLAGLARLGALPCL